MRWEIVAPLAWVREFPITDWGRGYILGFLNGRMVPEWQAMYVRNVLNARRRGISA